MLIILFGKNGQHRRRVKCPASDGQIGIGTLLSFLLWDTGKSLIRVRALSDGTTEIDPDHLKHRREATAVELAGVQEGIVLSRGRN